MTETTEYLQAGITTRLIETTRLSVSILEREGDDARTPLDRTVVLVHDVLTSSLLWQEFMQDLPSDLRVIAVDLRGFGSTENLPVDATNGLGDFSEDLRATLDGLDIAAPHLVGWGMGGGVVMQYALSYPARSLTLEASISPYGFGGTNADGTRLTDDDAGCGAGAANPKFVDRLNDRDTSADAETSPRNIFRATYVAAEHRDEHDDLAVAAMLSTSTSTGNYPGDTVTSAHWPFFAPGRLGVLNAMAPKYFNASGIVHIDPKPPVLWVHGDLDAIVADGSFNDANHLGALGILPDWPGADVAPAQPMVSQLRDVLETYAAHGGAVHEVIATGAGHAPHLEQPALVRRALLEAIGYIGPAQHPAPPTEAIILRSAD